MVMLLIVCLLLDLVCEVFILVVNPLKQVPIGMEWLESTYMRYMTSICCWITYTT